jgi:hypothetical protein
LLSFGTSFPILVFFNEKYLATLTPQIRTYWRDPFCAIQMKMLNCVKQEWSVRKLPF